MEIEEEKSSFIINYKPYVNKGKGKVAMPPWPLPIQLEFQVLKSFVPKQEKTTEPTKN